ncbi:MAG: hypothetical protein QM530_08325 [Phycisphaerales bacterium]|nr:hypothetical protein [Phycisphaerales bacterium]
MKVYNAVMYRNTPIFKAPVSSVRKNYWQNSLRMIQPSSKASINKPAAESKAALKHIEDHSLTTDYKEWNY